MGDTLQCGGAVEFVWDMPHGVSEKSEMGMGGLRIEGCGSGIFRNFQQLFNLKIKPTSKEQDITYTTKF